LLFLFALLLFPGLTVALPDFRLLLLCDTLLLQALLFLFPGCLVALTFGLLLLFQCSFLLLPGQPLLAGFLLSLLLLLSSLLFSLLPGLLLTGQLLGLPLCRIILIFSDVTLGLLGGCRLLIFDRNRLVRLYVTGPTGGQYQSAGSEQADALN